MANYNQIEAVAVAAGRRRRIDDNDRRPVLTSYAYVNQRDDARIPADGEMLDAADADEISSWRFLDNTTVPETGKGFLVITRWYRVKSVTLLLEST